MTDKFHKRFDISIGTNEARRRFIHRANNAIFRGYLDYDDPEQTAYVERLVALHLGAEYSSHFFIETYVGFDFYKCLEAIEAYYFVLYESRGDEFNKDLQYIISRSEIDLGIIWKDGEFLPKGAELLDDKLVDDNLKWLRNAGHETVLQPYEKGLKHLLGATKNPDLLSDVITDMYEALEALAQLKTGNNRDLSANRELFIANVKASDEYKIILKDYIEYANRFRHAQKTNEPRPKISEGETESFVYLTGIFIRLAL